MCHYILNKFSMFRIYWFLAISVTWFQRTLLRIDRGLDERWELAFTNEDTRPQTSGHLIRQGSACDNGTAITSHLPPMPDSLSRDNEKDGCRPDRGNKTIGERQPQVRACCHTLTLADSHAIGAKRSVLGPWLQAWVVQRNLLWGDVVIRVPHFERCRKVRSIQETSATACPVKAWALLPLTRKIGEWEELSSSLVHF